MITIVKWKSGYQHKIDAKVAFNEIERLKKIHKNEFTTKKLAEAAKPKKNPLHPEIYDKSEKDAANAYYLERAGQCLRSLVVEIKEGSHETRAYHPIIVKSNDNKDKVWYSTEEIMEDPEKRTQVLKQALSELRYIRKKYNKLKELSTIWVAIDSI